MTPEGLIYSTHVIWTHFIMVLFLSCLRAPGIRQSICVDIWLLNSNFSHQVFRIHRSKVDDEKCCMLVSQLLDHPSLQELDFSHNQISDRGARAIGKLLNRSQLKRLVVCNNQIRASGAQALAHALARNATLMSLNLRLNRIGDEGGQALAQALIVNKTLENLHLGGNNMSEPTAVALSQALVENWTLKSLNLSNNRLGVVSKPENGKFNTFSSKTGTNYNFSTSIEHCKK